MNIDEWLLNLDVGDRVRVGHPRMREREFIFTKIREATKHKVAIYTSCGNKRWFSRKTGLEIDKPANLAGTIRPTGVI